MSLPRPSGLVPLFSSDSNNPIPTMREASFIRTEPNKAISLLSPTHSIVCRFLDSAQDSQALAEADRVSTGNLSILCQSVRICRVVLGTNAACDFPARRRWQSIQRSRFCKEHVALGLCSHVTLSGESALSDTGKFRARSQRLYAAEEHHHTTARY